MFESKIDCLIFSSCSGCKLKENVSNPPILQEMQLFFQKMRVPFSFFSQEILGWRSKAKLAVRGSSLSPKIGLFEEGTHNVVTMPKCPLHHPLINEGMSWIHKKMKDFQIEPYKEETGQGRLRYLQMVVDRKKNKLQGVFIFNGKVLEEKERLFLKDLTALSFWHSIWLNFQPEKTNTILGPMWELFYGEEDFCQEIGGISFSFHPQSFSQAHLPVFEKMLKTLESWLPEETVLLELYAGVGCIGLYLAQKSAKVTLVESSPFSKLCFEKTISRVSNDIVKKCSFIEKPVEEFSFPEEVQTIIVDPPRKGLSKICKEKINASQALTLLYVSCGPHSFKRDCQELLEAGWLLSEASGFLLFPGSDHIELMGKFERIKPITKGLVV